MVGSNIGKKDLVRILGPIERYYSTSNGETTDANVYSYHRAIGKSEQDALKRVDYVMSKHGDKIMSRPRK